MYHLDDGMEEYICTGYIVLTTITIFILFYKRLLRLEIDEAFKNQW